MKSFSLIALLLVALLGVNSLFVVEEGELAVLFQFGAAKRSDFAPGLHFKMPFVQNVRKYDRRILTLDRKSLRLEAAGPERYLTSEKKDVLVDFFVKWRIIDVAKFYTSTLGNEQTALDRLWPIVRQALSREINERKLQEVVSGGRVDVMQKIRETSNAAVGDLGIEIVDVRINRIDLPEDGNVIGSVFERMRAERTKVANELRALGREASETIRADADRQRQVLVAEATRDAAKARGEGEARAAEIYANAYQGDAQFYEFYRSLEAYRHSFRNRDGILVLDPKSEFFKYFGTAEPLK